MSILDFDDSDLDDEDFIAEARRQFETAPICEPVGDEYVGECHWSRTGWAIWRDGGCSCRPARRPTAALANGESP